MFKEKKIRSNINRLRFLIGRSSDIDLCILYLVVLGEYAIRNKDGHLDSLIDEMKTID